MTRSPSYLAHNRYGYIFRMRVPHDLKNWLGKNELECSLKTGYLPQARSRAMILGGQYKQLFRWARYQTIMGKMTEQEIQELVALVVDYIGDADLYGIEGMTMDSRRFPPEGLRGKINRAKDAALHHNTASKIRNPSHTARHLSQQSTAAQENLFTIAADKNDNIVEGHRYR